MNRETREICAGIHGKGDFLFVCILKMGKKETQRFPFDQISENTMIRWLEDEGCTAVVSSDGPWWPFLQITFLQSHIPLYVYTGKKLPVKAGKPMAEVLARRLLDGDPQIGLPRINKSNDRDIETTIDIRNRIAAYIHDGISQLEEIYRSAGIDCVSLLGGANEVQTIQLLLIFCRPLSWKLRLESLKEMQELGTVPALMNLEWLLDMYEQRQDAPEAGEVIEILKNYLRERMLIRLADIDIIRNVGEEKAKELLTPLSHLGYGELMDTDVLMKQFLQENGGNP